MLREIVQIVIRMQEKGVRSREYENSHPKWKPESKLKWWDSGVVCAGRERKRGISDKYKEREREREISDKEKERKSATL